MKIDPAGSISEASANAMADEILPLLRDHIQKKQDELMRWVNAWHRIDLHILVFVLEITLGALRDRMYPVDEKYLAQLRRNFGAVSAATVVRKERGHEQ